MFKSKNEAVDHYKKLGYSEEDATAEIAKRFSSLPDETPDDDEVVKVVPLSEVEKLTANMQKVAQDKNNEIKSMGERLNEMEKMNNDLKDMIKKRDAETARNHEYETTDADMKDIQSYEQLDRKFVEDVRKVAPRLFICNHIMESVSKGRKNLSDFSIKGLSQIFNGDRVAASFLKKALYVGSGNTNLGAEFIPTQFAAQYVDAVRVQGGVISALMSFDMPTSPYKWPTSLTDPTWYHVGETTGAIGAGASATAISDSEPGTDNMTFTAEKLAGHIYYDADITEDSILAVEPFVNEKLILSGIDVLERCVLFGDTTTGSLNINYNGAGVTTTAGAADYFLVWDGIVHKALVDGGTNYYVDAGGNELIIDDFEVALVKAGKYTIRPSDCRWFVNMTTYNKMLSFDDVKTIDKLGAKAAIVTGQLASLYGIPVVPSNGIPLAYTDGKISHTASDNTYLNAALSYAKAVFLGFRRRAVNIESEKILETDQYHAVLSMRADVQFPHGSGGQVYIFDGTSS